MRQALPVDDMGEAYWTAASVRGRAWLPSGDVVSERLRVDGFWEDHYEWRISTTTSVRIEPSERYGRQWFHVTVATDQQSECWCPSVARALEWTGTLFATHMDAFYALGWPSWESKAMPGDKWTM